MLTHIYVLQDPFTNEIRYVGKTVIALSKRLHIHTKCARKGNRSHCYSWMRKVLQQGGRPEIHLVQDIPGEQWAEAERYWIRHFRERGCPLTNLSIGGDGAPGVKQTPEAIAKRLESYRGYKHTEETKNKISRSLKLLPPRNGRPHSTESKALMSELSRAAHANPVSRRNYSMAGRKSDTIVVKDRPQTAWSGSKNSRAKLTEDTVANIKWLIDQKQHTFGDIAAMYGVTRPAIGMIANGRRWPNVAPMQLDLSGTHYEQAFLDWWI